jgi:hypothetical protein
VATDRLTAGVLMALAGLHVAWAGGAAFPFDRREDLADAVAGTQAVPGPASCVAVAAALTAGAALVQNVPVLPRRLRTLGLYGMAGILGLRGAAGLTGTTEFLSPGSNSERFRRLDRRLYSPLCLALAAGSVAAAGHGD